MFDIISKRNFLNLPKLKEEAIKRKHYKHEFKGKAVKLIRSEDVWMCAYDFETTIAYLFPARIYSEIILLSD